MAAQQSALAPRRTARSDLRRIAPLVLLTLVAFGVAFAIARSTSGRTVRDPARVVKVVGPVKTVGTAATDAHLGAPSSLARLVVSGGIARLAALPVKKKPIVHTTTTPATGTSTHRTYTPPSTYTPPTTPTHTTPASPTTSTAPKITVG